MKLKCRLSRLAHRIRAWYHPPSVPMSLPQVVPPARIRDLAFNRAYAAALLHIDYHSLELNMRPSSQGLTMTAYEPHTKWGCTVTLNYETNNASDAKRRALLEVVYRHVQATEALRG